MNHTSLSAYLLMAWSLAFTGCQKQTDQIVGAAREVNDSFVTQSRSWVRQSESWQDRTKHIEKSIKDEFGANGAAWQTANEILRDRIEQSRIEAERISAAFNADLRLTITYANMLMVRNLDAALAVIKANKDKKLTTSEFQAKMQEMLKDFEIEPAIGRAVPDAFEGVWNDLSDQSKGFELKTDELVVTGFGLTHSKFKEKMKAQLSNGMDVTSWLVVSDDNTLKIKVNNDMRSYLQNQKWLELNWDQQNLGRISIDWYGYPRLPAKKTIKLSWNYKNELVSADPNAWDFGVKPKHFIVRDSEGSEREINVDRRIVLKELGLKRSDRLLTAIWEGSDFRGGQAKEIFSLEPEDIPRVKTGTIVKFTQLFCVKQTESTPDEVLLTISVDGKQSYKTLKEGVKTGDTWPLNITAPIKTNCSAHLLEDDDAGDDDLGTITLDVAKLVEQGGRGAMQFAGDGGQYQLFWELDYTYAED